MTDKIELRRNSDILIGQLVQSVETLGEQIADIHVRLEKLQTQLSTGKGVLIGLIMAAGVTGAGASALIKKIFGGE